MEIKTKKLKKLFAKLQSTKQEIQDLQEEHVRERQELEQTQNELTRELKLKAELPPGVDVISKKIASLHQI